MSFDYNITPSRRKKPFGSIVFIAGIIMVAGIAGFIVLTQQTSSVISPIPEEPHVQTSVLQYIFARKKDPDDLKDKIQRAIDNQWSNYSIYVVDYTSKFTMGINETVIYDGGSVNKIPILAALYDQVQKGKVDLDKTITTQPSDIQDYGTGSIRYDPPGTTYSVKTLARLMMQKSDNTAAYLLANYVMGFNTLQSLVSGWGLTQTDMVDNKTSNKDMERILKKIFDGAIADSAHTAEMLAFLKDSDFETRLPALLPPDAVVYHKIGTVENGIHDAGIVTRGKTRYYIGVFTQDVTDEAGADKLIAQISRIVFDYLD